LARPRVWIYGSVLLGIAAFLGVMLRRSPDTDVILLRGLGMPFTVLANGEVANPARIKILNRENDERAYSIEVASGGPARILLDDEPLRVSAGGQVTRGFLVAVPGSAFVGGRHEVRLRIRDGHRFTKEISYQLLGPHGQGGT
jgi:hypothetical protein